jgi:hypothetical protein
MSQPNGGFSIRKHSDSQGSKIIRGREKGRVAQVSRIGPRRRVRSPAEGVLGVGNCGLNEDDDGRFS